MRGCWRRVGAGGGSCAASGLCRALCGVVPCVARSRVNPALIPTPKPTHPHPPLNPPHPTHTPASPDIQQQRLLLHPAAVERPVARAAGTPGHWVGVCGHGSDGRAARGGKARAGSRRDCGCVHAGVCTAAPAAGRAPATSAAGKGTVLGRRCTAARHAAARARYGPAQHPRSPARCLGPLLSHPTRVCQPTVVPGRCPARAHTQATHPRRRCAMLSCPWCT